MTTTDLKSLLEQMPVRRLRMEAVVDDLLSNDFCRKEELVLFPEQSSAYHYDRDVLEIETVFNEISGTTWHRLDTPRDGLFDTLPERLFHHAAGRTRSEDQWQEIRAEEERQEEEARQFFLPFDNALLHQRVRIEQFEKRALAGQDQGFLSEFLKVFWPESINLSLTDTQQASLFQLTTLAHKIAGHTALMKDCFEELLGDAVELEIEHSGAFMPVQEDFVPLGEATLGVDSLTATSQIWEYGQCLKIAVGSLSAERIRRYTPQAVGQRLIDFLAGLFVPIEIDWRLELVAMPSKGGFELNAASSPALLGFTTVL